MKMRGLVVAASLVVTSVGIGWGLAGCAGFDHAPPEVSAPAAEPEEAAPVAPPVVEVFAVEQAPADAGGESDQAWQVVAPPAQGLTVTLNPGPVQEADAAAEDSRVFRVTAAEKDPSHPAYGKGAHFAFVVNGVQGKPLVLTRGQTYTFEVDTGVQHDFYFSTSEVGWGAGTVTEGVTGQFTYQGEVTFSPSVQTPDLVYYQCRNHKQMGGEIHVINEGEVVELPEAQARVTPAAAPPAGGGVTTAQVEQKLRLAEMMLTGSTVAKQAEASGDAEALALLTRARTQADAARAALAGGDASRAMAEVNEVFEAMNSLRRQLPDEAATAEQRRRYDALSEEVETFAASYTQHAVRLAAKAQGDAALDRPRFEGLVSEAEVLADQSRYAIANERLGEARNLVTAALTALLQDETVVYDKSFATPKEEYAYELARFKGYEELVPIAIEQKRPSDTALELIEQFVSKARDIRAKAEGYAAGGDYATGIRALQDATLHVQRALRIAGVQ